MSIFYIKIKQYYYGLDKNYFKIKNNKLKSHTKHSFLSYFRPVQIKIQKYQLLLMYYFLIYQKPNIKNDHL